MYELMKKLIGKKFYPSYEEVQTKLDVFYAMDRMTQEQYSELSVLATDAYTA